MYQAGLDNTTPSLKIHVDKDKAMEYKMLHYLLQNRNGIKHVNIMNFMQNGQEF